MKVKIEKPDLSGLEKENILKMLFLFELRDGSCRSVGAELGWSKSKAQEIYSKCKQAGIGYDQAVQMSEEELLQALGKGGSPAVKVEVPDEYWEWVCRQLHGNARKTLKYVWTEYYSKEHPEGLGYSQFVERYNKWLDVAKVEIILPQERVPGREIFIDWVGDTIMMLDQGSGRAVKVYFFIATIGDSSFPFVEPFLRMDQVSWTQAHIDMLNYYGGLPRLFIPDNVKTAIDSPNLYDPQVNHSYMDLANHYGIGIAPARVKKPQDKGSVEAGVKFVEAKLLPWLEDRNKIYVDLEDIKHDVDIRVREICDMEFTNRCGTRRSVFEALDKPMLRPLPLDDFICFETITKRRLPNNWHFDIKERKETFYYSFPYIYVTLQGYAHVYPDKVEIFVKGVGRVATHKRRRAGKRYITEPEHAPKNQQERLKYNSRTGDYYRKKAEIIGEYTLRVVNRILTSGPVEEQGYKSCDGIIRMAGEYGREIMEGACKRALELGRPNYTCIKDLVSIANKPERDKVPPSDKKHENLRTGEWS